MSYTEQTQLLCVVLLFCAMVSCNNPTGSDSKNSTGPGTVTDIDGNVYQTVKIGNQVWTVENIRTTKYNDGTPVTLDTSRESWRNASTEKYCYYDNTTDVDSIKKYGALYNGYVVSPTNPKKIAPAGWHVPTDAEWYTLENYLIANGYNWDSTTTGNKIAKAMGAKTDWVSFSDEGVIGNNLTTNNSSGFSALPGGYRDGNGDFECQYVIGSWLSATECDATNEWCRRLSWGSDYLCRYCTRKRSGNSIRLVKD